MSRFKKDDIVKTTQLHRIKAVDVDDMEYPYLLDNGNWVAEDSIELAE